MINKRNILPVVMLLGSLMAVEPAVAERYQHREGVSPSAGGNLSSQEQVRNQELDRAVARIRERTGGRVLAAETQFVDGRPVHMIRILTPDGKVRNFRIDARTGQDLR